MKKNRLMIVDDHAVLREGLHALLGKNDDIEIVGEASNGNEAIAKCLEINPDILLMDISMPFMDGLEATREIKRKNRKTKVLILTQHSNREYILSAFKAGADGYLPKSVAGPELLTAIRTVCDGNSYMHPSIATTIVEEYRQKAGDEPFDTLSSREREILKLLADGLTCQAISEKLFIGPKTVLGHKAKLMEKLDIHNRTDLIKFAVRKGLTSVDN